MYLRGNGDRFWLELELWGKPGARRTEKGPRHLNVMAIVMPRDAVPLSIISQLKSKAQSAADVKGHHSLSLITQQLSHI